jgi:hypothetical protein
VVGPVTRWRDGIRNHGAVMMTTARSNIPTPDIRYRLTYRMWKARSTTNTSHASTLTTMETHESSVELEAAVTIARIAANSSGR